MMLSDFGAAQRRVFALHASASLRSEKQIRSVNLAHTGEVAASEMASVLNLGDKQNAGVEEVRYLRDAVLAAQADEASGDQGGAVPVPPAQSVAVVGEGQSPAPSEAAGNETGEEIPAASEENGNGELLEEILASPVANPAAVPVSGTVLPAPPAEEVPPGGHTIESEAPGISGEEYGQAARVMPGRRHAVLSAVIEYIVDLLNLIFEQLNVQADQFFEYFRPFLERLIEVLKNREDADEDLSGNPKRPFDQTAKPGRTGHRPTVQYEVKDPRNPNPLASVFALVPLAGDVLVSRPMKSIMLEFDGLYDPMNSLLSGYPDNVRQFLMRFLKSPLSLWILSQRSRDLEAEQLRLEKERQLQKRLMEAKQEIEQIKKDGKNDVYIVYTLEGEEHYLDVQNMDLDILQRVAPRLGGYFHIVIGGSRARDASASSVQSSGSIR